MLCTFMAVVVCFFCGTVPRGGRVWGGVGGYMGWGGRVCRMGWGGTFVVGRITPRRLPGGGG